MAALSDPEAILSPNQQELQSNAVGPHNDAAGSRVQRRLNLSIDIGERALMVLLFIGFAVRFGQNVVYHPYNLLALASEASVCFFIVTRRTGAQMTLRPTDWLLAVLGTMLPLLIQPSAAPLAAVIATSLMLAGVSISLWAQLTLRHAFGLAAANRGVVDRGPYRIVRHPMYAGYLLTSMGILLANPLAVNLLIIVLASGCQVARILAEEAVLKTDPRYAELLTTVRRRLVPGVY